MDPTKLIYTVLSGKATKEEIFALDIWISLSEENRNEFNDIKLLHEASVKDVEDNNDQFYDGLLKIKQLIHNKSKRRRKRKIVLLSTMAILLLFIFFLFLQYKTGEKKQRLLKFDNASLESVIDVVEKEYQVQVEVAPNAIQSCRFTGSFYKASANDIVMVIALSANLKYEVVGDGKFRMMGDGCSR